MSGDRGVEGAATPDGAFIGCRPRLFGVAYRVLGSVGDAEDVVQEAWLRWAGVDIATVADPTAFLVTTVTRLAIDRLRRVGARRESYPGQWLPEPLLTTPDPAEDAERTVMVSMAMLVVLETLSPLERTVFVLHEAFAYPYEEIAEILGRSPAAVRQLAHRAREHVQARRPRFETDRAIRREVTEQFLRVCLDGDVPALLALLAPEVTLWADGGGRSRAPLRPIRGRDKVARFLIAVAGEPLPAGTKLRIVEVNGGPAAVLLSVKGPETVAVLDLDVDDHRIIDVHLIANPDKLRGLAPLADTEPDGEP